MPSETSDSVYYELVWDDTTVLVTGLARTVDLALAAACRAWQDAPAVLRHLEAPRSLTLRLRGTR